MKQILITGVHSYIGENVGHYLSEYGGPQKSAYRVEYVSLRENVWEKGDWSVYDSILHVAGLAHADIGHVSKEAKKEYYEVNCGLTVRAAEKAKREGVRQFIYMSSVIVYGDSAAAGGQKHVLKDTLPAPVNFYGDSKWRAEQALKELEDGGFAVAIVRAPMIYGKNSKGNFPLLAALAEKMPLFPAFPNKRSILYIENLAEFLRLLIDSGKGGVFFPQNGEYASTSQIVQEIAVARGRQIRLWRALNPFVKLAGKMPGKVGRMANKAFGSLTVDRDLSVREIDGYQRYSLRESIRRIYGEQL